MTDAAVTEARKALNRLRRAAEKTLREMEGLEGSLKHAEGGDFPGEAYQGARDRLEAVMAFVDDEAQRLQEKILQAGGLEPGRVRRSS
ncbi:MAG TPA: hypothetical protein VLA43_17590 [Longimicrobiales bacterium]|nr:hypothetical protein [Longimicrobiales bacterium]